MPNLAFLGSSEYSLPVVRRLAESDNLDLKLLVTKPGMEHYEKLAESFGIIHLTPSSLKGDEAELVSQTMQKLDLDLAIVADYGLMIPDPLIYIPDRNILNIHFSSLPKYRGASPVQYTILKGDPKAYYTFLELEPQSEPKMDSGDIIHQNSIELQGDETTELLYLKLFELAAEDVEDVVIKYLNNEITPQSQDHSQATFTTPSAKFDRTTLIKKDDAFITHQMVAEEVERATRAFTPWPIAWTTLGELEKIVQKHGENITVRAGKDHETKIQLHSCHVKNDQLQLDIVQAEGKKQAPWKEFKNGWFE